MDPGPTETLLFNQVMQALAGAMTTDAWNAVRSRFVKLVRRGKRREAESRLEMARQRLLDDPRSQADEASRLADEFRDSVDRDHFTAAILQEFIEGVTRLVEASRPAVNTSNSVVQGDQFNFHWAAREPVSAGGQAAVRDLPSEPPGEYAVLLRHVTMALEDSAAALRAHGVSHVKLTDEIVALSRVARESQKEAHDARLMVFWLAALVTDLRRRLDEVTHERDELLDRRASEAGQDARLAELERELGQTQLEVRRLSELYARSQQECTLVREQWMAAEQLAAEAWDRVARYESERNETSHPPPGVDEYEQALDDLVADREVRQGRLHEMNEELARLSVLPSVPGELVPVPGELVPAPGATGERTRHPRRLPGRPIRRQVSLTGLGRGLAPAGELAGLLACLALLVAFIAFGVLASVNGIRDDQHFLADMHTVGVKPAASTLASSCYETACGGTSEDLTYLLRPGRTAATAFQVTDPKSRYLNTSLNFVDIGKSCGASPRADYAIYDNSQLLSHGELTAKESVSIRDLPIGRLTRLKFRATLRAPSGCVLGLELSNPTLDALKGWSWVA